MHTPIERKPDPVREAMQRHRAVIETYERQAAGIDDEIDEREGLSIAFGLCVGAVLSSIVWSVGLALMRWVCP